MRKKTNFIKLIQMWGIIFLIGSGVTFVTIDVIRSYRDFNSRADQIRTDYIDRQKQLIKQEVGRAVDMIRYEKAQSENLTRRKIKSRVYEAYSIAQNIYQQNQATESKIKIQQMILDALRPIRFENGSGYYFITRLDGVEMLFADRPQMEGLNLLNMQDTRGQYVIKDMIEIAKESGEGFYEYHWTKPASEGNDFKKISFIKRFEPYDWIIGTGLYVDDVESQIKADLLSTISRIRFGKEGYIFVNKLNGDALVSNGKVFSGTKKLWEVFNDNPEKMKDIFEKEYNAALKPEGDYIYYSWIKLTTSDKESPKTSFIYGIPDLQWLVGAGVYLDDVETDIALMQTELTDQIKEKMLYYILIIIAIIAVFFLFYNWLNQGLKKDFKLFISFFNSAAFSDEEIDRENIKFVELDQMAEYANKMLADRRHAEETIRESEARYRSMMEAITDPVYICSHDFRIEYMNQAMIESVGRDATGERCHSVLYDKDEKCSWCVFDQNVPATNVTYEQNDPKTGLFYSIICSSVTRSNAPASRLYIFRDITRNKMMEKERIAAEVKFQQASKMESIGTLAGGIAHDFNNILSAVIGYAELALDEVEKGSRLEDNLQEVYTAGLRAKDLVKQILTFARQAGEELKPVQVNILAKEALKLLRSSLPTTIEIKQDIESDSLIMADPTQVHQIFMNLCTNAGQAMEEKGGVLRVGLTDVRLDADFTKTHEDLKPGDYLKLSVSDTGSGISPEVMKSIFDPYFTTKAPGEGTGMGLATVHGIVKRYGGEIVVDSEVEKGSIFTVYLPITKKRTDAESYQTEALPYGTEKILFVDDELPIAAMGGQLLEGLGYQVTVRTSSVEALALFRSKPDDFDLIITDMTMPNMTGDKLTAELMKIRPGIPVILCTGYSKKISNEAALDIGIKAFAYKPTVKADFARTIRKVLDEAKGSTQG